MSKLIVITGQTATGKTRLALDYAKKYDGELINADSRQVYKGLDIITGKDKEELGKTPIHLYDVIDPKEYFSSYDFKIRAEKEMKNILRRGKTPIVVGGTYLYIFHFLYGIATEKIKPDFKLRKELENKTVAELQKILGAKELAKLNQSDRNNPRRLTRRIEMLRSENGHPEFISGSDQTLKHVQGDIKSVWNDKFELYGLRFKDKQQLTVAIRKRVEKRLVQGAVEELKKVLKKGYNLSDHGLQANGCKEIFAFINGKLTKQQLIDKWVLSEIRYAKRQYTFMKRDKNIQWKDVG